MMTLRKAEDRGYFDHGWLQTRHTFSFADYYDEEHMGFRVLRVINEDVVAPRRGFGTHGHRDMEILTYVLSGQIAHKDSTGVNGVLRPGELQRMSAGTGVMHSEMNGGDAPLHFLQIWILPERTGLAPSYEQKPFPEAERKGRWRILASPASEDGAVKIHQDARLYATLLGNGERVEHTLGPSRHAWLQIARGSGTINGVDVKAGDGVAISDERKLVLEATEPMEALLFDLP